MIYITTAVLIEKKGDAQKARIFLEEILEYDQKHYNTLVHLGVVEAKSGDYDQAAEHLKRARNIKNTDIKVTYNLANIHIKQGKFEEATPLFEEVSEHDKENIKLLQKLMICLGKIESFEKVESVCKRILALDKTNSKALAYLSRALKENNKFSQLEKLLTKIDTKIDKFNKTNKKDTVMKIKSKLKEKLIEVKNLMFNQNMVSDNDSENEREYPIFNIIKVDNEEHRILSKQKQKYELNSSDKEALFYLGNHYFKVLIDNIDK